MICMSCRMAGALLPRDTVPLAMDLTQAVNAAHAQCRGKTWCDCQHKLTGVNWNLIADPRRDA